MIKSFDEIDRLAGQGDPVTIAILAADEREVLLTAQKARERRYITPFLIGQRDTILSLSDDVGFDVSPDGLIEEHDFQRIADTGIDMLFAGEVDIAVKGNIPTSYVYRSVIKHEKSAGGMENISVNTIWDIPGVDHLTNITDTGVNINPDSKTKKSIILNAARTMALFGYQKPRVAILSAYNGINAMLGSFTDARGLQVEMAEGYSDEIELLEETSIAEMLLGEGSGGMNLNRLPHVLLVPHLDAGNIFSKLDFMIDVTRRSFVMSSKGPVIIPSRSDTHEFTTGELAMGVVVSRLLKGRRERA